MHYVQPMLQFRSPYLYIRRYISVNYYMRSARRNRLLMPGRRERRVGTDLCPLVECNNGSRYLSRSLQRVRARAG